MPGYSYDKLLSAARRRQEESRERTRILLQDLKRASPAFRRLGITKAVLFGSYALGRARQDSDVDLLVAGLPEETFFETKSEIERCLGREVDLHTAAERAQFVQRAERHGIVVYEA